MTFAVLTRFLHIATALVLAGGTVFIRCVLLPAATTALSPEAHAELRSRVMGIWKRWVHGGIALLLLSGGINYGRVIMQHSHKGDGLYHGLLGLKMLLAFGVFFLASALVGKSPLFEGLRKNSRCWLTVNLVLVTIIVFISAFLRLRPIAILPGQ